MTEGRRFVIRGRVQGVFFRESTRVQAQQLGVVGHALNLDDGCVEVLAFGTPPALDDLARWLNHGPAAARVDHVLVAPVTDLSPPAGFRTGWR